VAVTILAICCGIGVSSGILGMAWSLHSRESEHPRGQRIGGRESTNKGRGRLTRSDTTLRLALGAVLAILVGVLTRWPAAVLLAASGGIGLPSLIRLTRRSDTTARTEAIAVWTELLRDTLAAASGLSQSIVSAASVAPDAIRKEVGALASRLSNGMPTHMALRMFADEIADPSADLVVCALMLAATARAQRLVDLLGALADSMREEVAMRLRVESNRASARSGIRTIIVFCVGFVSLLALVARAYLTPFGSAGGQLVLILVGTFEAAGIVLMMRLLREPLQPRLLLGYQSLEGTP
jgi:tight adherence protein B